MSARTTRRWRRAALAALLALAACRPPPGTTPVPTEAGLEAGADASAPALRVELLAVRSLGAEGEQPAHLLAAGPERLLALSDRAAYLLDLEGRVLARSPLPVDGSGGVPLVASARWDGVGAGLVLRWSGGGGVAAGSYLALADGAGAFTPGAMLRLGAAGGAARGDFDGAAHQLVWSEPGASALALRRAAVVRGGAAPAGEPLATLPAGSELGDWRAAPAASSSAGLAGDALCAIEGEGALLRRFTGDGAAAPVALAPGEPAAGPCLLAPGGGALAAAFKRRARPPAPIDGGADARRDLGLGALSFDVPVLQLVKPDGTRAPAPVRLSATPGTVRVESLLWDGARFLALVDAVGTRGGRLLLTALDAGGSLLARDLELPIEVEPGTLVGGRLVCGADGCWLLFAVRRPWDEGVLQLARLRLAGG